MPAPSTPQLTLIATSPTSFTARVNGADAGSTSSIYYVPPGGVAGTLAGSFAQNGQITVNIAGTYANGGIIAYVISTDVSGNNSLPGLSYVSLASTDTTPGAVIAALKASVSFMASVPGGVWLNEVPETQPLPFVHVTVQSETPDWTTESSYTEVTNLTLTIYALKSVDCSSIAAAMKKLLDWVQLPYQVALTVAVERTGSDVGIEEARTKAGLRVFHRPVHYKITCTRSL